MVHDEYVNILKKCKFFAKPDIWYIGGSEVILLSDSIIQFGENDLFNAGKSQFRGWTNEIDKGYSGLLPRIDKKICPYHFFYIYDENGYEISTLTLDKYKSIINP